MGAQLENLTPGAHVLGVLTGRAISVVQAEWHGPQALTLTYRDDQGGVGSELLYRSDEARLSIETSGLAFAFDADGQLFRLVSEAMRIRLAHLFDPLLAVNTSSLDPLPHQIQAVYQVMLPRQPLRGSARRGPLALNETDAERGHESSEPSPAADRTRQRSKLLRLVRAGVKAP